jgi:hypothetical protein
METSRLILAAAVGLVPAIPVVNAQDDGAIAAESVRAAGPPKSRPPP